MPWLYREAPLNGICEGSGNIICLDILRTLAKDPGAREALEARFDMARGNGGYDRAFEAYRNRWSTPPEKGDARWFAEETATLLTAAILFQTVPDIAAACTESRLNTPRGLATGALSIDPKPILLRLAS